MQIIRCFEEMCRINHHKALAIGNFDGVHRGHQALIKQCVDASRRQGLASCVLTFDPHPQHVVEGRTRLKLLNTAEQKQELIEELGVDYLLLLRFDRELADTDPHSFIKTYISGLGGVKKVLVGFNFNFGKKSQGTPQLLQEAGLEYGFEATVLPPVLLGDVIVSSTLIREKYAAGQMEEAARLLGRWPQLQGKVVSGYARGRIIGFPTANIDLPEDILLPSYGVYVAKLEIPGQANNQEKRIYPAAVNIGLKPTFSADKPSVEAHLLDFAGDLYEEKVKLTLLKQIRKEMCFPNAKQLGLQIAKDIQYTRDYFINKLGAE